MESLFFSSVVFLFGLALGSFLNCLIYRMETNQSFLKGRSFCPKCKHELGVFDLIPVVSFFLLKGRCRYCKKGINWQYVLVETATGAIFLLIFIFNLSVFYFLIAPFLIIVFVYDFKHYIIPDKIIYPAILITFTYIVFNLRPEFFNYLLSGFGSAGFFLAIVLMSRGKWMGIGDIKLAFLMGLILGYPSVLPALFLAFLTGAIIGIGLILFNKKSLKSEVPFGPFLVLGTFAAMFFGKMLTDWYFNVILL